MNQRGRWYWRQKGKYILKSIRELLCITVSFSLEVCVRGLLNCSERTFLLFIIPPNKQQIMSKTWNQRGTVFCSLSHCRSGAEGWERLVNHKFSLHRHCRLFLVAAVWQRAVGAPPGFLRIFSILRAVPGGWQGWPGCVWLLLLSSEIAWRCSLEQLSCLFCRCARLYLEQKLEIGC